MFYLPAGPGRHRTGSVWWKIGQETVCSGFPPVAYNQRGDGSMHQRYFKLPVPAGHEKTLPRAKAIELFVLFAHTVDERKEPDFQTRNPLDTEKLYFAKEWLVQNYA